MLFCKSGLIRVGQVILIYLGSGKLSLPKIIIVLRNDKIQKGTFCMLLPAESNLYVGCIYVTQEVTLLNLGELAAAFVLERAMGERDRKPSERGIVQLIKRSILFSSLQK